MTEKELTRAALRLVTHSAIIHDAAGLLGHDCPCPDCNGSGALARARTRILDELDALGNEEGQGDLTNP